MVKTAKNKVEILKIEKIDDGLIKILYKKNFTVEGFGDKEFESYLFATGKLFRKSFDGLKEYIENLPIKYITSTYRVYTEESLENGEAEDQGWHEIIIVSPDKMDINLAEEYGENVNVIDNTVAQLEDIGATEWVGRWFSTIDPEQDYSTGNQTYYDYFLNNFTDEEIEEIVKRVTGRG